MQHSVWAVETTNSNLEIAKSGATDVVPVPVLARQFSFRRIWQGKGSHTSASKVLKTIVNVFLPLTESWQKMPLFKLKFHKK